MLEKGCWIFLSHSGKNIDKIRIIRNELERLGNNPLAFHLKCLSDESDEGKQELFDLICREIEVRDWFIYCDSPEARNSNNVKEELSYIKKSRKEKVFALDITGDIDDVLQELRDICFKTEVFVTYASRDRDEAQRLIQKLVDRDYSVWDSGKNITVEENYGQSVENAIIRCSRKGFHIAILSDDSVNSPYCLKELQYSYEQGACIIPVIKGNPDIPYDIQALIDKGNVKKRYHFYPYGLDETIDLIVDNLDKTLNQLAAESRLNHYWNLLNDLYK